MIMDRRSLLKMLGIVGAVAVATPTVTLAALAKGRVYPSTPPDAPLCFVPTDKPLGRKQPYVRLYCHEKEISGGGYERQPVKFAAPVRGECHNEDTVMFPTATSDWGKITHMAIYDGPQDDAMPLFRGLMAREVEVLGPRGFGKYPNNGDTFKFLVDDINITVGGEGGAMSDELADDIIKLMSPDHRL